VPPDKLHCPALAITALKNAVGEHLSADDAEERR
jgi:NifU-like protein involved in Fe-S cluster formation